jgi:glycosyltransferase involved in cell wall biosynthesis
VSVVVPVFNPGPAFDDLIASLDRQTLAPAEFEVVLCDDGSDAPTRQRLARAAETRPNVRVLNLPHTGWPGTPRNHGIDAATGEYVYFVDQDDRLFDAALEKLCDYADLNGSDVVIGREVGVGRDLPRGIFRRNIPRATLGEDPLLELLTPHKLFRTSFLRDNGIRFPDGKVRLEDHLFVMRAYFQARTISVLADEPCYAWVKHPGSASSSRIDPETYFPHLETVLDLIEAHTEPGPLRDRLLRHWFRGKILKRLSGRRMLKYPDDYRSQFLDVVTPIVQERFGPGVDKGLALPHRVRAALLRADRRADLLRLAEFEAGLDCRVEVVSAGWSRGGGLELTVEVRITRDGEEALVFERADPGRWAWRPPPSLGLLPAELLVAGRDLRGDSVDLALRDSDGVRRNVSGSRWKQSQTLRVSVDPIKLFGKNDPSRGGPIVAKVRRAGWTFDVPLTGDASILASAGRSPFLAGRTCELTASSDGTVHLRREWPAGRLKEIAGLATRRVRALIPRR